MCQTTDWKKEEAIGTGLGGAERMLGDWKSWAEGRGTAVGSGPADVQSKSTSPLDGLSMLVDINDSEFHGETHGLDST